MLDGAVLVLVVDAAGFGAAPVVSREAPTDESPPLGNELEPKELEVVDETGDEPIEDMPLILLD